MYYEKGDQVRTGQGLRPISHPFHPSAHHFLPISETSPRQLNRKQNTNNFTLWIGFWFNGILVMTI